MYKDTVRLLQGGVDALRGMELLLEQKRELLAVGYQENQLQLFSGLLVLKLEGGEVRWLAFNNEFIQEIWVS
ncbi:MAG: hypothetical protein ACOX3R_01660 [Desulfitobacteriia bacterium]|jgi:hypothetical protein